MINTVRLLGAGLALTMAASVGAFAQTAALDPSAPLQINVDSILTKGATCTTILTGEAKTGSAQLTQGKVRLVGRTITVHSVKRGDKCGQPDRIVVDKDVFYVTPDGTVRADHAVYEVTKNEAVFTGAVVVVRGGDVATGSKLTVNTKTNDTTMEGPVRGLFMPAESQPAPAGRPGA